MSNYILIEHRTDNPEEIFDLDEVLFVRVNWDYVGRDEPWSGSAEIIFKNGVKEKIGLSEVGWEDLLGRLMLQSPKERKGKKSRYEINPTTTKAWEEPPKIR